ncbi:MAG: leucyl aminopeptidase family protein [Candidatus Puniceispirillaceae bacterium]
MPVPVDLTAAQFSDHGFTTSGDTARPLFLLGKEDYADWLASAPETYQNWLAGMGFQPSDSAVVHLPAENGQIEAALLIISDEAVWAVAKAAKTLKAGIWKARIGKASLATSSTISWSDIALGWGLAQYQFASSNLQKQPAEKARLYLGDDLDDQTRSRIEALISGTNLARELVNLPANQMGPEALAHTAEMLAKQHNAHFHKLEGKAVETQAPALHVVGKAAAQGPKLVELIWGDQGPLVTLIGKGITFDSGGLDLKPSKAMELMKKDMGGAAQTLGLASAIMAAGLPVRLRVLVAIAENAVSSDAMRPLDIIQTAAGIDVEVGNTDAEGRLILADALYHAQHGPLGKLPGAWDKPDVMLDFATLTGAARVALGTECPAIFGNESGEVQKLISAGMKWSDPLWQLPLFEPYERMLKTGHGALSSTGQSGYGGAITAALFLRHFAGTELNWMHIDLMAWNLSDRPGRPKGGEAMGLRACFAYIADLAGQ